MLHKSRRQGLSLLSFQEAAMLHLRHPFQGFPFSNRSKYWRLSFLDTCRFDKEGKRHACSAPPPPRIFLPRQWAFLPLLPMFMSHLFINSENSFTYCLHIQLPKLLLFLNSLSTIKKKIYVPRLYQSPNFFLKLFKTSWEFTFHNYPLKSIHQT